jgi:hypothetical protein
MAGSQAPGSSRLVSDGSRWEIGSAQIPVPRFAPVSGARVFEGLVLQARSRQSDAGSVLEQACPIRRYEMRHRATVPNVAVQPEATVHGVNHSLAPFDEFLEDRNATVLAATGVVVGIWRSRHGIRLSHTTSFLKTKRRTGSSDAARSVSRRPAYSQSPARNGQLQAITPSTVAGASGVALP